MAGIKEFRIRLRNTVAELARTRAEDALAFCSDVLAQGSLRINETGLDSEGDRFSQYSLSYAKERRKRGRPTAFKDYNDTGQLNASKHPVVKSDTARETVVSLTVRGNDNALKVLGNLGHEKRKRGVSDEQANLLTPSKEEITNATEDLQRRRERRLRQKLGV